MRKFYLGLVLLMASVCSYAFEQDNVTLTAFASYEDEEFADEINLMDMNPGDEAYVVCTLDNPSDSTYQAFQLLVTIPDGFTLEQIWDEDEEEYYTTRTLNELSRTNRWTMMVSTPTANTLKCVLWTNNPDKAFFPGTGKWEGQDLFYFKIKAGNTVPSFAELTMTEILFSVSVNTGEVDEEGKPIVENEAHYFPNIYNLYYRVGQSGYATLCYNSANIDFSEGTLQANIAKNGNNGYAFLTPIEIVPSGTPVVVKGEAGSYMLPVKNGYFDADPSIANNDLKGTAESALTVDGNNIFALASKTEGIGFYRCAIGVVLPRYKAYFDEGSSSVDAMLFEETTDIQNVKANDATNDVYTISGMKVNDTQRKGIYVTNGKKVVVK